MRQVVKLLRQPVVSLDLAVGVAALVLLEVGVGVAVLVVALVVLGVVLLAHDRRRDLPDCGLLVVGDVVAAGPLVSEVESPFPSSGGSNIQEVVVGQPLSNQPIKTGLVVEYDTDRFRGRVQVLI